MSRFSDVEVFLAVVRAGGFSAAARERGITQSAVSRRIAGLEARLGVRLVSRSSRGIRLTDAGRLFERAAERALSELDAAEGAVTQTAREPRGTLRVHLPPAFGRRWIAPRLVRFAERHPHVALHVTLDDRVVDLGAERGDVAVRIGRLRGEGLIARRLGEARVVLCGAPAYLARRGRPERPEDLAAHDALVLAIYAPRDRWVLTGPRQRFEVRVRPRFLTNDVEMLLAAARGGLGLAVLPDFLAADDLHAGTLEAVLPRHRLPAAPIQLVLADRKHLSRAARAFADFLVLEVEAESARRRAGGLEAGG